jgi:hypothetical protein
LTSHILRNEIFARLDDQLYDWLKEAAARQELALSVLLRRMIQQAADQDRQQKGQTDGQD